MIIVRGTTPTHEFTIPCNVSEIVNLRISYGQCERELFVKEIGDCQMEGNTIRVTLTQEDTFSFDCKNSAMIHLRVLLADGTVPETDIIIVKVGKSLNNEVL